MANLGFTVDSSQVLTADANFRKLIATSDVAQKAAERLNVANSNLGGGYVKLQQQAQATHAVLERIDRQTGVTGGVKRAAADITAYGQEMDRLRAKFNPMFAAQQRFEQVTEEINQAQRVGAITAEEAAAALMRQKAAYEAVTVSIRNNTVASRANSVARGGGASAANATNLMFQGQDIAMMTLMGQAPGMLALQQGLQVGGIFSQMGSARAVAQGLGSAVAMMLNPLNLATIAFVGLGAAGVQALMGMMNSTEDATSALDRHETMLKRLLVGYDDLHNAANEALEGALRLPAGVIASDLQTNLEAQEQALQEIGRQADDLRAKFTEAAGIGRAQGIDPGIVSQIDALSKLKLSAASTKDELDAAAVAAKQLFNTTDDPVVKEWANDFYQLTLRLRETNAQIASTDSLLRSLPKEVQIRIALSSEFNNALEGMQSLFIDPRSQFDVMREQLENQAAQATATAKSYGEVVGIGDEYQRVLSSINAAEAKANVKGGSGGAGGHSVDRWSSAIENFQRQIDQQRLETDLIGKSTYEVERQRAAFDLLGQAKQANIQITAPLIDQINQMSSEYAGLAVEMEQQQRIAQTAVGINNTLASGFANMFGGILSGSKSAKDAIADLLGSLGQLLLNQAFMTLFSGGTSGGIGGVLAGLFSFDGGGYTGSGARTGGVDGKGGFPAILHPNETVVDHTRRGAATAVSPAANQNSVSRVHVTVGVDIDDSGNILPFVKSVSQSTAGQVTAAAIGEYDKGMPVRVNDVLERNG
jgi:hypothetical protein